MTDEDWRDSALCREVDPDMFFPGETNVWDRGQLRAVRDLCRACDALDDCREWALDNPGAGFAAGMTVAERAAAAKARTPAGAAHD